MLPSDIITNVIAYLPDDGIEKFYGPPRLVNKNWRKACQIAMVQFLNHSKFPLNVYFNEPLPVLERFGRDLRRLHLYSLPQKLFEHALNFCPTIESFGIDTLRHYQFNYLVKTQTNLTELKIGELSFISDAVIYPLNLKRLSIKEISDYDLISFFKACPSLEYVDLNARSAELIDALPASLKKLNITLRGFSVFVKTFPSGLRSLSLTSCNPTLLVNVSDMIFPTTLTKLCLNMWQLHFQQNLPDHIQKVKISTRNWWGGLSSFPSSFVSLTIDCGAVELPQLPAGLKSLSLASFSHTPPRYPSTLKTLYLHAPFVSLGILPSLTELHLDSRVSIDNISCLPITLKTLHIEITPQFLNLPQNLEYLTFVRWEKTKLPSLPSSLKSLGIHSTPVTSLELRLCTQLHKLKIFNLWGLRRIDYWPDTLRLVELNQCRSLEELPLTAPRNLRSLSVNDCLHLGQLPIFYGRLSSLTLKHTTLSYWKLVHLPEIETLETDDKMLIWMYRIGVLSLMGIWQG